MLPITHKDRNKVVVLDNGHYAQIISVIKENGNPCLIVGRLNKEVVLTWDFNGTCLDSEYNIERMI